MILRIAQLVPSLRILRVSDKVLTECIHGFGPAVLEESMGDYERSFSLRKSRAVALRHAEELERIGRAVSLTPTIGV